jgi:isocitrate dehydrogenase
LALYWAQALVNQNNDAELKAIFTPIANDLSANEASINQELIDVQGKPQNIDGYYKPVESLLNKAMKPSEKLNGILAQLN